MQRFRGGVVCLVSIVGWLSAATAFAHIDLLEPEPRAHGTAARGDTEIDVNSNLKSGPCGQITDGRSQPCSPALVEHFAEGVLLYWSSVNATPPGADLRTNA